MDAFKVDRVDARKHHVTSKQRTLLQDILVKTPTSVWLVLAGVLVISILYLRLVFARKSAAAKAVLNQRRKAGIPDSDRRPWRIAFVDAEKARLKRDKEKNELALLQKRPPKSLTRSATVNSTLSLPPPSPFARSPRPISRNTSTYEPHPWSRAPSPALSNTYIEQSTSKPISRATSPQPPTSHHYRRSSLAPVFHESRPASPVPARPSPARPSLVRPHSSIGLEEASSKKRRLDLSDADTDVEEEEKKSPKKRAAPASPAALDRTKRSRPNPISTSNRKVPGALVAQQGSDDSDGQQDDQADVSMDQEDGNDSRISKAEPKSSKSRESTKDKKRSRGDDDESVVSRAPRKKNRKTGAEKRGKEWTNLVGEKFKVNQEGKEVKLVEVKEWKLKYQMPADSRHPDKDLKELVAVEKWVDEDEFERLKKASMLAWQPAPDAKSSPIEDESMSANESEANSSRNLSIGEKSLFYARGPGTPLRSSTPQGKLPATNTASASPRLLNGRIRIPSTTKQPRRSLGLPNPIGSVPRLKKRSGSTFDSLNASASFDSPSSSLNPSRDASPAPSNSASPAPSIFGNPKESNASLLSVPKTEEQPTQAPAASTESGPPKHATFSFGVPATNVAAAKVESKSASAILNPSVPEGNKPPTFSLGPSSTSTKPAVSNSSTTPTFNFGAIASPLTSKPAQHQGAATGFSFGAGPTQNPAQPEQAKPAFSFATTTANKPHQNEQSTSATPAFSFGAKPSTPSAPETSSKPAGFSFGSNQPAVPTPNAAFSFGQPAASQPAANSPAAPFAFGQPQSSNTSQAGFKFGSSAAPQSASPGSFTFGNSSGSASPAFGQSPVTTPTTQQAGFTFGAAPTATFNAGSAPTNPNAPPSPVRPIRRAPVRRR